MFGTKVPVCREIGMADWLRRTSSYGISTENLFELKKRERVSTLAKRMAARGSVELTARLKSEALELLQCRVMLSMTAFFA